MSHEASRSGGRPFGRFVSALAYALLAVLAAGCSQAPPRSPSPDFPVPVTIKPSPEPPGAAEAIGMLEPETPAATTVPEPETAVATAPACVPAPPPKPRPRPIRRKPAPDEPLPPVTSEPPAKANDLPAPVGSALQNVRTLAAGSVLAVLGKKVWGPNGDDLGRVIDVLIDPETGAVRSAIIDFGGFLGVGNRKIAVDWSLLRFVPGSEGKQVRLRLNRSQVLAAPEYREASEHASEVIAPAGN